MTMLEVPKRGGALRRHFYASAYRRIVLDQRCLTRRERLCGQPWLRCVLASVLARMRRTSERPAMLALSDVGRAGARARASARSAPSCCRSASFLCTHARAADGCVMLGRQRATTAPTAAPPARSTRATSTARRADVCASRCAVLRRRTRARYATLSARRRRLPSAAAVGEVRATRGKRAAARRSLPARVHHHRRGAAPSCSRARRSSTPR